MESLIIDEEKFWSNVDKTENCWIWKGKYIGNRCPYFSVKINGKYTNRVPHALNWYLTYGEFSNIKLIHTCGNKLCVKIEHLRLAIKVLMKDGKICGRECIDCKQLKLFEEFYNDKDKKFGYSNHCKLCSTIAHKKYKKNNPEYFQKYNKQYRIENLEHLNEYNAKYREENREYLNAYMREHRKETAIVTKALVNTTKAIPCISCGISYPTYVMDLDHIDRSTKKFNISTASGRSHKMSKITNEISKCQVLCANCHRNKSHEEEQMKRKEVVSETVSRRRQRQAYVNDNFKKTPCMDCGVTFNHWQYDFDHRDPSTKFKSIFEMTRNGSALDKIKSEIDKCDLVCANCHRERTHQQQIDGIL